MAAFRAGAVAAALLISSVVVPSPARAVEAKHVVAGVRLAPPACPIAPLSVPAFVESLRVELAGRTTARDTTLVSLAVEPCDTATTHVQVAVTDVASGRGSARDIGLEDVALDARPRALALAVAELVRAALPPPAAPETTPAVEAPPVPEPPAVPALIALEAHALLELYPARDTHLWGGRVAVSGLRRRWQGGLFGQIVNGERGFAEGVVELQSFGVGVFAGPRWGFGRVTLSPSLAASFAWARILGHAATADVIAQRGSAPTAAVRARLAVGWHLDRTLALSGLVEAGAVVRSFDATVDGARAAGISGATLVLGAGITFGP